jgi:hypothetical protein
MNNQTNFEDIDAIDIDFFLTDDQWMIFIVLDDKDFTEPTAVKYFYYIL